jgi:hypothetical protein
MVTESGELAYRAQPTELGDPRPNASAAEAEWVLHNNMPPKRAGSRREDASREAGRMRRARLDAQTGNFMIAEPFWFRVGLLFG